MGVRLCEDVHQKGFGECNRLRNHGRVTLRMGERGDLAQYDNVVLRSSEPEVSERRSVRVPYLTEDGVAVGTLGQG